MRSRIERMAAWGSLAVVCFSLSGCDPKQRTGMVEESPSADTPAANVPRSESEAGVDALDAAVAGGRMVEDARPGPDGARDSPDVANSTPSEAGDPLPAAETRVESAEWHSIGHDLYNTRSNLAERQIGVDNVAQLSVKWAWETTAVTGTPAYYDGKLYFGDLQGYVVALDAASGTETWRVKDPNYPLVPAIYDSALATEDAVFLGASTVAILWRVNRASGAFEWAAVLDDGGSPNVMSSPVLIGDRVLIGVASFQNVNLISPVTDNGPFRGSIVACDSASGAVLWRFVLTEGAGVGVCSSAAIDPTRTRMFIGTGQNYDDTDSPYADSLIALNYQTGEYVWHRQFTSGDEYSLEKPDGPDHDVLSTPVLFTVDGVDMVAAGDKGAGFYALTREGALVWQKQLTPGGHHGGVMGAPAYHDGVLYVCSNDYSTDQTLGIGQDAPAESVLFALQAKDGAELWSVRLPTGCYGAVSYANGVVYLPTIDGNLRAFHGASGEQLWSDALGQSSAGGVTIANGMLFVSYGWDWLLPGVPGGVKAYGLP